MYGESRFRSMTHPSEPPSSSPSPESGRYRFRRGNAVDPKEDLHPEMVEQNVEVAANTHDTIAELIAMQEKASADRPEKPEKAYKPSARVQEVFDLLNKLETTAAEDHEIALFLVRNLEDFHDGVVKEMQEDDGAKHSQIVAWAIDADRLMRSRLLLESVDLD